MTAAQASCPRCSTRRPAAACILGWVISRSANRLLTRVGFTVIACASLQCRASDPSSSDVDAAPELRFGTHQPCTTNAECGDAELCGYALQLGCAARGECVTAGGCGEHSTYGPYCACDGGTIEQRGCSGFYDLPSFYAVVPAQSSSACPWDPAYGDAACGDAKSLGEGCESISECCSLGCSGGPGIPGVCCIGALQPCTRDGDCCGIRRCTDENATFRRCL